MGAFKKSMLSLGTYESPEGTIVVTPDRLMHWQQAVKRVQDAGYQIPMRWNHADLTDIKNLQPIKRLSTQESSERTAGHLVDFRVSEDGRSAEIIVETLTKTATEAVESNAVFISPVLFDEWEDGHGQTYSDIIGSVDLVDLPVDYSQKPFQPTVMAMSTSRRAPSIIRMATKPNNVYRLSTEANMDPESQTIDEETNAESNPSEDPAIPESSSMLSSVISGLAQLKIALPADTNTENFLDRLNTALMTAAAQTAEEENPNQVVDPGNPEPVSPAVATMSTRVKQLEDRILTEERAKVKNRLDNLLTTGRMSPAEHAEKSTALGVQRMSLGTDGTVKQGRIGDFIESREAIPEGAFWDPKEKIKRLSTATPKSTWTKGAPDDVEAMKQQKKQMLRRA
ncbi:MAG: hypothetical protein ACK5N9_16390 [Pirellula sp.]|jgi:hypothetical protein